VPALVPQVGKRCDLRVREGEARRTEPFPEQQGVDIQLEDASKSALNEAEREELRAMVSRAVGAIPPDWPLRTFA